jgi:hypothetical protein
MLSCVLPHDDEWCAVSVAVETFLIRSPQNVPYLDE